MTLGHFIAGPLADIATAAGVAGAVVLALFLAVARAGELETHGPRTVALLVGGVAFVGASAGYAGGLSRDGVVGDIVPAVLAIVGGASAYLFGAKEEPKLVAAPVAAALALSLILGYETGADKRGGFEARLDIIDRCLTAFSAPALLTEDSAFCRFPEGMGKMCAYAITYRARQGFPQEGADKEDALKDFKTEIKEMREKACGQVSPTGREDPEG